MLSRDVSTSGTRVAGALVLWALVLAAGTDAADFSLKGQNEARYRRGYPAGRALGSSQGNFENIFDLAANYERFRIYLRQRYLLPSEFDVRRSGWDAYDKRYLEYRAEDFTIRGGSFYRIWGRGLLFGTTEKTELNFDNGLEGLLIEGQYGWAELSAFKGVASDTTGTWRESAEGAYLRLKPVELLRLGASVVYADETPLHPPLDRRGYEIEIQQIQSIGADLYVAYTQDRPGYSPNFYPPMPRYPHGLYAAWSWQSTDWGLLLDYKNYHLLVEDPYADFPQPFIQYPPTALPEATMMLIDRIPRPFKPYTDEVGVQADFTANFADWWDFRLNANLGSESGRGHGRGLPSIAKKVSRYYGVLAHLERSSLEGMRQYWEAGRLVDVQVLPPETRDFIYTYTRDAVGGHFEQPLGWNVQVTGALEVMWFRQEEAIGDTLHSVFNRYRDEGLTLALSRSPWFEFTLLAIRSGDRSIAANPGGLKWDDQHRYWPSAELMINPLSGHQVKFFIGHERGGLRCSGGLCRWVNPFRGVRVTLTSQF